MRSGPCRGQNNLQTGSIPKFRKKSEGLIIRLCKAEAVLKGFQLFIETGLFRFATYWMTSYY